MTVTFNGSVNSGCALSSANYTLTDNRGPTLQGPVTVGSDGSFAVALSLSTRHKGRVYTLAVTASNTAGSATSGAFTDPVQKCHHEHDGDRDHDSDQDSDHDD